MHISGDLSTAAKQCTKTGPESLNMAIIEIISGFQIKEFLYLPYDL